MNYFPAQTTYWNLLHNEAKAHITTITVGGRTVAAKALNLWKIVLIMIKFIITVQKKITKMDKN